MAIELLDIVSGGDPVCWDLMRAIGGEKGRPISRLVLDINAEGAMTATVTYFPTQAEAQAFLKIVKERNPHFNIQ